MAGSNNFLNKLDKAEKAVNKANKETNGCGLNGCAFIFCLIGIFMAWFLWQLVS